MRSLSRAVIIAFCAAFLTTFSAPSAFANYGYSSRPADQMRIRAATVAPAGYLGFCIRYLTECVTVPKGPTLVELTDAKAHDLDEVQSKINSSIVPREDPTHTWDYPKDGTGDCNKFALAKQH